MYIFIICIITIGQQVRKLMSVGNLFVFNDLQIIFLLINIHVVYTNYLQQQRIWTNNNKTKKKIKK